MKSPSYPSRSSLKSDPFIISIDMESPPAQEKITDPVVISLASDQTAEAPKRLSQMEGSSGSNNIPSESSGQMDSTVIYMDQMEKSSGSNNIPSCESSGQIDSTVIYMDQELFNAAAGGDMEPLNPHINHLHRLVDGNQNTALHIHLAYGGFYPINRDYVQQLLQKCPRLLQQPNDKGEIPLHIAVKCGDDDIVPFLIERSEEQHGGDLEHKLRKKDKDDNTALHTALQEYYCPLNLAKVLLKEDPDLIYSVNKNKETPLYLAAGRTESGWNDLVADQILHADHCKPTALVGPHGRTILHAAILAKNEGMIEKILARRKELTREKDEDGRTPLHYAAYIGSLSAAEMLLKCDAGAAYLTDNKRRMSPLHMASWQGKKDVMKAIISSCPGCIGIVDKEGWNFLHFAFITEPCRQEYLLDILLPNEMSRIKIGISITMWDLILAEKDGITVMEVFRYCESQSTSLHPADDRFDWKFWIFWERPAFWDNGLPLPQEKFEKIQGVLNDINNAQVAGLLPADHSRNMEDTDISDKNMREVRETHLLVVTLVATVTFAAGLNLPGGYNDKEGSAILKNSAFKAFVIADVLAFVSSLSAVVIHFYIVFFRTEKYLSKLIRQGDFLTLFATVMMVIAFSTGLYATLSESSPALAIASCCIANAFFLIFSFFYLVIKNKRPHDEKLARSSRERVKNKIFHQQNSGEGHTAVPVGSAQSSVAQTMGKEGLAAAQHPAGDKGKEERVKTKEK